MNEIVNAFRNIEKLQISFGNIKYLEDYKAKTVYGRHGKPIGSIPLPSSNVIKIILDDQSWIAIRPSGTEPKLKIYYSANAKAEEAARAKLCGMKEKINQKLKI